MISEIFDELETKPESVLNHIKNDKDKLIRKKELFYMILCFRVYNKKDFQKSLQNILKDDNTSKKIYEKLAQFPEIFGGMLYEKDQILNMVKNSKNFKNIKSSLSNITSISDYFEIILKNLNHIFKIREKAIEDIEKENKTKKDKTKKKETKNIADEIILEFDQKI